MNIVTIASEVVPFAKTGGLADVAGTLPRALAKLGSNVSIIMPYYGKIINAEKFGIRPTGKRISVGLGDWKIESDILTCNIKPNISVYFISQPTFFDRNELYQTKDGDYPDNAERFTFFSKAAIETMLTLKLKPDVVHVHDWQASLVPLFLKTHYKDKKDFSNTKTLLTIHNLGYQGLFPPDDMRLTGLGWEYFTFDKLEFYGKLNFLKAGIVYADAINTVSKKYAEEILTKEYGCGLESALAERKKVLFGILNGIDYEEWNPEIDNFLPAKYSASQLGGKATCKNELLKKYKLPSSPAKPLIGLVGRLTVQKGLDILAEGMKTLIERGFQFAILGTGEPTYHDLLQNMAAKFPKQVGLVLGFDNSLAHQIEAGSDFFLMPSRYEPCGLNQMISLKYGTIPIVRATGGLDDSIVEFDPKKKTGNGFKFAGTSATALIEASGKALSVFNNPSIWKQLMTNAMKCDFSWNQSAKEYQELYKQIQK